MRRPEPKGRGAGTETEAWMKVEKRMFVQREDRSGSWQRREADAKGLENRPWKRREKPGSEGQLRVEGTPGAS